MKLENLAVRNLRSLGVDSRTGSEFSVDLATGLTVLVGPNNCGKSNVVRALELALDLSHQPDPHLDAWKLLRAEPIEIRLRFRADPHSIQEARLLDLIRGLNGTNQGQGEDVHFVHRTVLTFRSNEYHRTADFGSSIPDDESDNAKRLQRALDLFHKSVGLVVTRSGEPVGSVLGGRFKNELTDLVRSRFSEGYEAATTERHEYEAKLNSTLFSPLTEWLETDLKTVFPDVVGVKLKPRIPEIDEMIAKLGLEVQDAVTSGLDNKGSGIRSGVVAALLRYLAEFSDTSTVFAVEEPEAFLHPGAQEAVRDHLGRLAVRDDMSVLLTTHSPFMVPRKADATVIALDKGKDGRTTVTASLPGDAPLGARLGGIFRDSRVSEILDVAARLPDNAEAVLVVEGHGDKVFIDAAARALGLEELLQGIHIQASTGVKAAVVELTMLAAQTGKPVGILLDCDDIGRSAFEKLGSSTFQKLVPPKRVLSYRRAFKTVDRPVVVGTTEHGEDIIERQPIEYEAEDLFSRDFQQRFADSLAEEVPTHWQEIRPGLERLECEKAVAGVFKSRFIDFVEEDLQPDDVRLWEPLIKAISKALK